MSTTTETTTSNTTTTNAGKNAGADFRSTQPKTAAQGEPRAEPKDGDDRGIGAKAKEVKAKSSGTADKSGRFGVAGKVSTEKIAFRICQNISLSLKPYGGLAKEGEFSIKPGGEDGAIKPFTSTSGRKQFKKVGIRVNYNFKQLLSVRHKFKSMPHDVEQIPFVLEEGLGVFEVIEKAASLIKPTSKLRSSRGRLTSSAKTSDTSGSAFKSDTADRYGGNDENVSRLRKDTSTSGSKLKIKRDKTSASTTTTDKPVTAPAPPVPKEAPSLSAKSKHGARNQPSEAAKPVKPIKKQPVRPAPSAASTATPSNEPQSAASTPAKPVQKGPKLSARSGGWGSRLKKKEQNIDPMKQFTKKITGRLNKITMDNFDNLAGQLEEIYENETYSTEQLTLMVSLIFEKTVQEHVYGPLYAKLCVALSSKNKSFDEVVIRQGRTETHQVGFKTVLIKVCQTEFEKGKRSAVFTDEMDAQDIENEKIKVKKILMGTMKFIGELYKSELLPSKIVRVCLKRLVSPTHTKPTEDDIEAACTLLATVGKQLDEDEASNRNELNKFYAKLSSIARTSKYSVRIKMLIQNLTDVRKKSWVDDHKTKADGPKELNKAKKVRREIDLDEIDIFDLEGIMGMGGDDDTENIQPSVMPIASSVVAVSQRQFSHTTRYGAQTANTNSQGAQAKGNAIPRRRQRKLRNSTRGRMLLESEDVAEQAIEEEEEEQKVSYSQQPAAQPSQAASSSEASIGRRKTRTALSASSERPCDTGKAADEEKLNDLIGDFLGMRANAEKTMETILSLKIDDRKQFVFQFIQRAVDDGKGERLASLLPKLLDGYVILPSELDAAFVQWFEGYTMEDNPQINKLTPQLLGNLLCDNEINFGDVLRWILLDTRANQPEGMLEFYQGDGMRNYIRGSKTITKALDLLALLFKELKEICFENGNYVAELVDAFNFKIDDYMNEQDAGRKEEVYAEWVKSYDLNRVGF